MTKETQKVNSLRIANEILDAIIKSQIPEFAWSYAKHHINDNLEALAVCSRINSWTYGNPNARYFDVIENPHISITFKGNVVIEGKINYHIELISNKDNRVLSLKRSTENRNSANLYSGRVNVFPLYPESDNSLISNQNDLYEEIRKGLFSIVDKFPEDRSGFDEVYCKLAEYRKQVVMDQTSDNPILSLDDGSKLFDLITAVKTSATDVLDVLQVRDLTNALK